MNYEQIYCPHCGNGFSKEFDIENSMVKCSFCNGLFAIDTLQKQYEALSQIFDEEKQEQIANRRKNLWNSVHEENIDSIKVRECCRELKKYLPKDFQANFYEIANGNDLKAINKFLNGIDAQKNYGYIEDIVEFMIKSLDIENLLAVNNLIERAYKQTDLLLYDKLTTKFAKEAQKVDECVYDTTQPRDVFIAYSSADMDKVNELVEVLEEEGLTCFVAMRNLQHGRGAVANYDIKLQEAIDNCKVVVLVSSVVSRTKSDARRKELLYVKSKDIERAPAEYANNYAQIPVQYKKPRVEFLIEKYKGVSAEAFMKEFFDGYEYRYNPNEVAERIFELLFTPVTNIKSISDTDKLFKYCVSCGAKVQIDAKYCTNCGPTKFVSTCEEYLANKEKAKAEDNYPTLENYDKDEFEIEGTVLNKYKLEEKHGEVKIPHGVTEIGKSAFAGSNVVKIIIPDSVFLINKYAFHRCSELTKIELPKKLMEIRDCAFYGCSMLSGVKIPEGVTLIGDAAFEFCHGIKSIIIPNSVTQIGMWAFRDCSNIESISISEGVTHIRYGTFEGCSRLINLVIPKGVTQIDDGAFKGCSELTSITIPDGLTSIGASAFAASGLNKIIIPDSVTEIGVWAFSNCSSLGEIRILSSKIKIGWGAFTNTAYFDDESNWENNVLYIGKHLIYVNDIDGSYSIKQGTFTIASCAFQDCAGLTSIEIPNGVTTIGDAAFSGCGGLAYITIPDSVTSIGDNSFELTAYVKDKRNWEDNVLYVGRHLIRACDIIGSYSIRRGTLTIADNAFENCADLTSIEIPSGVTRIGNSAFYGCSRLKKIAVPKNLTAIGDYAFQNCKELEGIKITERVTCIGEMAFSGCYGLEQITIPDSVIEIGIEAFEFCSGLTSVTMPERFRLTIDDIFGAGKEQIKFTFTK